MIHNMNFLIFDTETTGVPRDYNAPMSRVDNWPRVIQLAFEHFDDQGETLTSFESLIKPDGWVVPDGAFWRDHGFSTEKCEAHGMPIRHALELFIDCINDSDVLVAHNITFDHPVIGAEMIRAKMSATKKGLPHVCTMKASTDFCRLPSPHGRGFKWPKLEELHDKLFGCKFDGAHDALADIRACRKCLVELLKREIIKIPAS